MLQKAWNAVPLHKPDNLQAFLGRITRNLAIDRYRKNSHLKRDGAGAELIFEELVDVVSGGEDPESAFLNKQTAEEIKLFLEAISKDNKSLFVLRYFLDSVCQSLQ